MTTEREAEHERWQQGRAGLNPGDDPATTYNDGMNRHAEWMPIEHVARHRDHSGLRDGSMSRKVVDKIRGDLESGRGMTDPLIMLYSAKHHTASVGEGNHRLRAAEEAGWTHVPVRISRAYDSEGTGRGFTPVKGPKIFDDTPDKYGWSPKVPEVGKPSEVFPPNYFEGGGNRIGPGHKMARVHYPEVGPGGDNSEGIMIALVPPKRVIDALPLPEDGEHPSNVHITLVYLGDVKDFTKEQVEYLPELIESWAETQKPLTATVQGVGTFANPGSHVLWAAADIPGGNHMWVSLADTLKSHGYAFKENHGWTPHLTMSYEKHHVRFLPKIERMEFKVREVWCCVGGRWESFRLTG